MKFAYLTDRCVQVGKLFYVRDKATQHWMAYADRSAAMRAMDQMYAGIIQVNGVAQVINREETNAFFSIGLASFTATIYAPGMGDFLIYEGQKRLNTYRDCRLAGDDAHIPHCENFLKVIGNSLCGATDDLDLIDMMEEIMSPNETAFRWVMHWLAARYQMPGFAPQTNLWFIGIRGTGKGTLVQAMTKVLGGANVGKASQSDMSKGWSDSLYGKELIEWDEFKSDKGWRDFGNIIKEKTGNDKISITQRLVGSFTSPAVAMHIFSSNEERPIQVEDTDPPELVHRNHR